jgi:hypothetical protein
MFVGATDPLGDSIIYRTVQGLATLGILGLTWKIASHTSATKQELQDGKKSFKHLTHRVNDHSERLFEQDGKQEKPYNEFE